MTNVDFKAVGRLPIPIVMFMTFAQGMSRHVADRIARRRQPRMSETITLRSERTDPRLEFAHFSRI